ncbi:unnamed protein product [Menidia menidia]|uniref:(Atlantic silverside) hypothetical protein n=1 Tax=Menidia menidia TaxID=238744 RepID=A0A8S4ABL1_9TELE|nr:unnamed protein product [Menidia menidia]
MDESSSVLVLSSTASSSSSSASVIGSHPQTQAEQAITRQIPTSTQQKQGDDSLIQVIEKLSRIVEKRPQRQKRGLHLAPCVGGKGGEQGLSSEACTKKIKKNCSEGVRADGGTNVGALASPVSGDDNNNSIASTVTEGGSIFNSADGKRTVTCYQCSLCPYLSQTLPQLKEHLKQHNEQHSDLILMCSECHFTSRDQAQLEAHVRLHFDEAFMKRDSPHLDPCAEGQGDILRRPDHCGQGSEMLRGSTDCSVELPQKKKWYSYEEYGLYRCLICSYVCSQQRMLKTHAWKHAGLVDCSYPIFEDEEGGSARREVQAAVNSLAPREDLVVFSPVLQDKSLQKLPTAFRLQLCMPLSVENKQDALNPPVSKPCESPEFTEGEDEDAYPVKDVGSEEPVVEVQVITEADPEVDIDRKRTSIADSLLSSAQKIINSGPNSAGHINVIVERLPSAEDSGITTKPLLLNSDVHSDNVLLDEKEEKHDHMANVKEEVILDCSPDEMECQPAESNIKYSITKTTESPKDENMPPAGRKRTHSESLRLHSLAAEALVAMPMRTPELPASGVKVSLKTEQSPPVDQNLFEVTRTGQKTSDIGTPVTLFDLELGSEGKEKSFGPLSIGDGDEESPAAKAGISLSLLTVIEKLRERSDQNASDEDILKELQDNAQFQNGSVAGVVAGSGAETYVCNIPGMDGLVGSPDGGLVDYIPGSERPYRCRLCRYSSGNKGYIKQHLRVHKQRQPYQCPICEHKASDSKDLENHMIHHCKTRMYQCKQCPDAFHYKLRSHEREHLSLSSDDTALTAVTETVSVAAEESDRGTDEDCCVQKMYKCDTCNYTSSTYVGVRNHRRIHNSDKPYRCCSCDFATTNMNSLKSHMRRHPQEHQAVQLLEQYRCSLCGYVCSHPPSLKSHMWKHAGDKNYNYEQVNKAINEAISQSSRAPQKLSSVLESVTECPMVTQCSKDKTKGQADSSTMAVSATKAAPSIDSTAGPPTPPTDPPRSPSESLSLQAKDPAKPQSHPRPGQLPGSSTEYCMLLFCCCICGFESTNKERLMEHMKEHEGDIISIILNKEQQQAGAQASLQTAE